MRDERRVAGAAKAEHPCAQRPGLCGLGITLVEERVDHRPRLDPSEREACGVEAAAPAAAAHRADDHAGVAQPRTEPLGLGAALVRQVALGAADIHPIAGGIADPGVGARVPDQQHAAPGAQRFEQVGRNARGPHRCPRPGQTEPEQRPQSVAAAERRGPRAPNRAPHQASPRARASARRSRLVGRPSIAWAGSSNRRLRSRSASRAAMLAAVSM